MIAIRQILSDRILATAFAVVLAYLLAFQGFTGNLANASTAIAAQDPLHVLCGSAGIVEADPAGADNPSKRATDCPCASLCRLASSIAPVILTPGVLLLQFSVFTSEHIDFPRLETPAPTRRGILADARGPPVIS